MEALAKPTAWQLKELSPRHKQACALLAQGVDRHVIAELCGWVPEYVTWLQRQPLIKEQLKELSQAVEGHLKKLVIRSIEVLHDKLDKPEVSDELALGAMNSAAKALGYGGHTQPHQNFQFVVQLPSKAESSEAWEAAATTLPARPPLLAAEILEGASSLPTDDVTTTTGV